MLAIGLISYIVAIPIFSYRIPSITFSRITAILFFFAAMLTWNVLYYYPLNSGGVGVYSGLFHVTSVSLGFQLLILVMGGFLLFGWSPSTYPEVDTVTGSKKGNSVIEKSVQVNTNFVHKSTIAEHSLLVLFSVMGSCLLITSYNLVSMYMSIEMQSFSAYILCTLYRSSQSATSSGLKYFLLGSLASSIIVLGTAVVYAGTGVTSFDDLGALLSVNSSDESTFVTMSITGGLVLIGIGYIFKVGAAPLYNWSPDVYDGVPTVVTSWISTMPKIGILVYLLNMSFIVTGFDVHSVTSSVAEVYSIYAKPFQWLLLTSAVLSLLVGSIVGLSQVRIKRLLTFSTISHVGFLLLCLAVSTEESIEGFVFYLVQYTMTNVNTFLTLLAFGYMCKGVITKKSVVGPVREFQLLDDLKGQFLRNPLLVVSFSLSLFSMAGIPPMIGFFAKQLVLYSVSYNYSYIAIIGILTSVISASYYLKIVQLMFFSKDPVTTGDSHVEMGESSVNKTGEEEQLVTSMHSTVIAVLTLCMTLYLFDPSILLNACHLLSLSLFTN